MKLTINSSDIVGVFSTSLCAVHCVATPILFIAQANSSFCCDIVPLWWQAINYIFLAISFFAVYRSSQNTTSKLIYYLLWLAWTSLFVLIINEEFGVFTLSESFTYFSAFSLAILHLYNLKYCTCEDDECCIHKN
jgi:hypothetical protein